ncbi:thioredoxin family protein [Porticoccaceae bacterium LTM1]|nr:thioredoxin family protein [Porticoccaceae bacterium LTM1]
MKKVMNVGLFLALIGSCEVLIAGKNKWDVSFEQGYGVEKYKRYQPMGTPKGTEVILEKQPNGALVGFIQLPLEAGKGRMVKLTESRTGKGYDRLVVDTDNNGSLDNDVVLSTEISVGRNAYWSTFSSSLRVMYSAGKVDFTREYPVALWAATDDLTKAPDTLRFSSQGFLIGEVLIEDVRHYVTLSDSKNDGDYGGKGDIWSVRAATEMESNRSSRYIGDFVWSGDNAYLLTLSDSSAREGILRAHNPGITKKDDLIKRDPYHFDRQAKRAAKPVQFSHDIEASIKQAQAEGAAYFIDFETTWCGACKQMDAMVYVAQEVVDVASEIICIKADGDEEGALIEKYSVEAYPTGILFSAEGKEIARFVGYQSVAEMKAFFQQAAKK